MKILAFDTSLGSTSVAISEGQNILAYAEDNNASVQAERLIPMIEQVLADACLTYEEIDYLGVINGPGSFTGIRIALAAAQGIIFSTNITGCAVTNFNIATYRARLQVKQADKIVAFLNASRGQLYAQIFNSYDNSSSTPILIDIAEAVKILDQLDGRIICTGSGIPFIYDQLQTRGNILILPRFSKIRAFHICRYVDLLIKYKLPLGSIEPLYIRLPNAIVKPASK